MTEHVAESELALYISGDLRLRRRLMVRLHLNGCARCRAVGNAFGADRAELQEAMAEMPPGVDWDRLAAEMTANIRVGLAAGECVAPRKREPARLSWRPAMVMAGVAVLLAGGWWLNTPPAQTRSLGRAVRAAWHGRASVTPAVPAVQMDERGLVVEANASGIELRENGSTLGVSQGTARPIAVSVSVQGSASARYVDADTSQVTITSVYAQ